MMYLGLALLCLTIVSGSVPDDDILKFMTPEEIQQVFHTDTVPPYEIVKINLSKESHKRDLSSGSKLHIKAFGRDINLWLHPRDTVLAGRDTPVYYARYNPYKPQGVEYEKMDGLMDVVGQIFENPYWTAAFVIGHDESGNPRVNGHIGSERMAVRSLPTRVAEEYRRRRRSVGDSDDLDQTHHHIVFRTADPDEQRFSGPPVNMTLLRHRIARSNSGVIPDTLYPEVLVVIEYSLCRDYGTNIYGLLEYVLAFWNGVDLKYRSLESPKFRFHISAIVLSKEPVATPYIWNNRLSDDAFDIDKALPAATYFYYSVKDTFPLDSYDTPVTLTKQDFGTGYYANIVGQAYAAQMCVHDDDSRKQNSVSIFKDNGAFEGVFYAAHELGHLIGAPHDPDTPDCVYKNGFLMSPSPRYTKNASDFSSCATEIIDAFIKNRTLDCLFNQPRIPGLKLPELMPGKIQDVEHQCRALKMGGHCENENEPNQDICVNFYCLNDKNECVDTRNGAADGTKCGAKGDNKFCLHMRCVSL